MNVTPFEKDRYYVEGERSRPDSVEEYLVSLGDDYGCSCADYSFRHNKFEQRTGFKYRCKHIKFVLDILAKQP